MPSLCKSPLPFMSHVAARNTSLRRHKSCSFPLIHFLTPLLAAFSTLESKHLDHLTFLPSNTTSSGPCQQPQLCVTAGPWSSHCVNRSCTTSDYIFISNTHKSKSQHSHNSRTYSTKAMGRGGQGRGKGKGGRQGGGGGGGGAPREVQISKALSFLLRHGAEKEGLRINEGGWANVRDVVS